MMFFFIIVGDFYNVIEIKRLLRSWGKIWGDDMRESLFIFGSRFKWFLLELKFWIKKSVKKGVNFEEDINGGEENDIN